MFSARISNQITKEYYEKSKGVVLMLNGIFLTIGVILVITSRFLYGLYDITLGGDNDNNAKGISALFCDILGTALIVFSIIKGVMLC